MVSLQSVLMRQSEWNNIIVASCSMDVLALLGTACAARSSAQRSFVLGTSRQLVHCVLPHG